MQYGFGERRVLAGVSLSVEAGSAAALIGPNGAGKTTLLRLISGALKPEAGCVRLGGREVSGMDRRERAQMVAVVPQQFELPFDYTVEQVVEQGRTPYLGLLRGMTAVDRSAVTRAMTLADVTGMRSRVFNELSGGERQRVKIALALAQEPKLLLLDEPTQNLDIGRQMELMRLLGRLRDEGITVLASIHELHLLRGNFSAVHLLWGNGSMTSGSVAEVVTGERLAAAFGYEAGRGRGAEGAPIDLSRGVE